MPVQFTCRCGKSLSVRDELAGKNVKCPGCGEITLALATASKGPKPPPLPDLSKRSEDDIPEPILLPDDGGPPAQLSEEQFHGNRRKMNVDDIPEPILLGDEEQEPAGAKKQRRRRNNSGTERNFALEYHYADLLESDESLTRLGNLEEVYVTWSGLVLGLSVAALVGLGLSGFFLYQIYFSDQVVQDKWDRGRYALISGIVGIAMIFGVIRNWRPTFYLIFQDGLAEVRSRMVIIIPWKEIKSFVELEKVREWPIPSWRKNVVTMRDETKHILDRPVKRGKQLRETIQTKLTDLLVPEILDEFDGGETVFFGSLGVNSGGLIHKNRQLDWDEIKSIEFRSSIKIYKKEAVFSALPWADLSQSSIPNVRVLKELLRYANPDMLRND